MEAFCDNGRGYTEKGNIFEYRRMNENATAMIKKKD